MIEFDSKLPNLGTTIFTTMSALANEFGAINLSQGFPDFDCSEEIRDRVRFHLNDKRNQYAPMSGVFLLRERIAQKLSQSYNIQIDTVNEITITAGATQGLFTAIQAFVTKEDEVIIIEPAYDSYRPSIELLGAQVVSYQLKFPSYKVNWQEFDQLISAKTKMIIINTPHNPTGSILSAEDMKQLEKLIENRNIVVLSDEVYEHLIYDGNEHQSVLRFPNLFQKSIAVYSFGKTFHCTGWKIGYVVAPEYLMKEFRKVHQFNVFSVSSFVQHGIADYLEDAEHYTGLPKFFEEKRNLFQSAMGETRFRPIPSFGSYFQLYSYEEISDLDDLAFAQYLTRAYGVATIPLSPFIQGGNLEKVVRFCFAKSEETLLTAAERLKKI